MEGELVVDTGFGSYALSAGNFGVFPISTPHAIRNAGSVTASWAEMLAPQPRLGKGGDTFRVVPLPASEPEPVNQRDPRTLHFGYIARESMNKNLQAQENLALSASMRTALLVYSGIAVKMMVDGDLSATQSTMFMVQYEARGKAGEHDHPFEETYMILDGEVTGVFDGQTYRLKPGDVAWAGVGCIHEFHDPTEGVIWLETSAPQPPSRHAYRWARDWNFLQEKLG
jgi:quercetin dioxygenase-like cupin family protein